MSKPTLKTIANVTGLAQTTVSRALKNDPKIAQATRDRVKKVADTLGYVPDRAAQRLRTGRTNVIAIVLSPHTEILGFRESMMAGLSEALHGTRYHLTMTPYDLDGDPMCPIHHIVQQRLADGVIFAGTQPNDPRVDFLLSEGFPFVTHGRTQRAAEHAWCDFDNGQFIEMALQRLANLGRRRVTVFLPPSELNYTRYIKDTAKNVGPELGLRISFPDQLSLASGADEIRQYVQEQLRLKDAPDAFVCPGEVNSLAVISAIEDSGLRINHDIDVVAKQTSQLFDLMRPRIDTIYEDLQAAGASMGRLLLQIFESEVSECLFELQAPVAHFRQNLPRRLRQSSPSCTDTFNPSKALWGD
ncbi:MAG: LacI family DNA-binding transcriptional regulator [Rhodobacteraceae bacterium]|nr:LacI family DNA-binding transcriptional regulator [Paracoccaceae bacterium]